MFIKSTITEYEDGVDIDSQGKNIEINSNTIIMTGETYRDIDNYPTADHVEISVNESILRSIISGCQRALNALEEKKENK